MPSPRDDIATKSLAETTSPLALDYPDTKGRLQHARTIVEKLFRNADKQCSTVDGMKSFLDDHAKEIGYCKEAFEHAFEGNVKIKNSRYLLTERRQVESGLPV